MVETDGRRGSQETTKTGLLLEVSSRTTFLLATDLGIALAFEMAEFTIPSE